MSLMLRLLHRLLRPIDALLNRVTMYRLALYYLVGLLAAAVALSATGKLPYDPYALLFSAGFLVGACAAANALLARLFGVTPNVESSHISALILALIITPIAAWNDLWFLGWAAVLAMASKYILTISDRHVFNPVAIAVAVTYFATGQSASWWVGNAAMLPWVVAGGLLVVRKLGRGELVLSFLLGSLGLTAAAAIAAGQRLLPSLQSMLLYSPLCFFASVILTEPLTAPPTRMLRTIGGALVGVLFSPAFHVGGLYTTPELAMLAGNVVALMARRSPTLTLTLARRVQLAPEIYDFIFVSARRLSFAPGQYMECTLGHDDPDTRGNRRFFTLASSPTEGEIRVGVKFSPRSSTFKRAMLRLPPGGRIVATQLAGDFTLPADPMQKCVFIAGGIGITPFRSMVKYALDTRQRRPMVLFYAVRDAAEFVYDDVFEQAARELGLRMICTVTDRQARGATWHGRVGRLTPEIVRREVPDYRSCMFYISGPRAMIDTFRSALAELGVGAHQVRTDYFSGLL